MKGRSISIVGIFAAVVGVILIICYNSISVAGVTLACGILFVGVGVTDLVFFARKDSDRFSAAAVLDMVTNAAAIVLGVSMLVFKDVFTPLIAFMFGLLVTVCALWQFFVLAVGARPYQLPTWLYVFPLLLSAGAIYIFFQKGPDSDPRLIMATGISFAVLGCACIIEGSVLGVARRNYEKAHADAMPDTRYEPETDSADASGAHIRQFNEYHEMKPIKRKVETTDDLDDPIGD